MKTSMKQTRGTFARSSRYAIAALLAFAVIAPSGPASADTPHLATIRGTITDEATGNPIEGICVHGYGDIAGQALFFDFAGSTDLEPEVTDAAGRYLMEIRIPYSYIIEFTDCAAPRPGPSEYEREWFDDVDPSQFEIEPTPVPVAAGQTVTVNASLGRLAYRPVDLAIRQLTLRRGRLSTAAGAIPVETMRARVVVTENSTRTGSRIPDSAAAAVELEVCGADAGCTTKLRYLYLDLGGRAEVDFEWGLLSAGDVSVTAAVSTFEEWYEHDYDTRADNDVRRVSTHGLVDGHGRGVSAGSACPSSPNPC